MLIVDIMDTRKEKFAFKDWLEQNFLHWQAGEGKRKTLAAFAEYLGISENTLKKWIGGTRKPEGKNVELIAEKLGDAIYDILNVPKPDLVLRDITRQASVLTDMEKQEILDFVEKLRTRKRKVIKDGLVR